MKPDPVRIEKLGGTGLIMDRYPFELPLNGFSYGKNISFKDEAIQAEQGWDHFRTLIDPCYFIVWHQSRSGEKRWFLANLSDAYSYDSTGVYKIGSGLAASNEMAWSSCAINGQLVLSNGIDPLKYWDGEDLTGTALTALPGWDVNLSAGTLCSYKNHVIAANLSGAISDPFAIIWSHPADPTASPPLPPNWDYTDPTSDAGVAYIPQEGGGIQMMLKLRNSVVVYRERASHILDYIGGTFILGIRDYLHTVGILGPHAACEIQGNRHFVVTRDDVIVHDGQNFQSIAENKIREVLFASIDTTSIERVYCVADHDKHEVWLCYPDQTNEWATQAFVWDWDDQTWTIRELSGTTFLAYGEYVEESGTPTYQAWDDVPESIAWDDMEGQWDLARFTAVKGAMLSLGGSGLNMEWLNTYNPERPVGVFTQTVERLGLNLTGDENVSMITEVYPRIRVERAPELYPVKFWFGSQEGPMDETVEWQGPYLLVDEDQYTSNVEKPYRFTPRIAGRRHAIRVESINAKWRLEGFDIIVRPVGQR